MDLLHSSLLQASLSVGQDELHKGGRTDGEFQGQLTLFLSIEWWKAVG